MSGNNFFDFREKLLTPRKAGNAGGDVAPVIDASNALSVTAVTRMIDSAIKSKMPPVVIVRGDVSNFNLNRASGHAYFTLKDANATINCVMFRSEFERVKFKPADGMELLGIGGIRVYAAQGRYQLYVNQLQPIGQGALELAFQQLRAKLEAEGLFRADRKRAIAKYPTRIVIVTSRETAALADMLKVLRRFPWLRLMLYHVPVQGDGSGRQIAAAIAHINGAIDSIGGADVILLGRGGGSLEDLWGFNDESLARAIVASALPIVTGIGHEVDVSIADLAADHHAHTPTEAATYVTLDWRTAGELLDGSTRRLSRQMRTILAHYQQRLASIIRHEIFRRPTDRIDNLRMVLDDRQRAMQWGITRLLQDRLRQVRELAERLDRQGPAVQVGRLRTKLEDLQQQLMRLISHSLRSRADRVNRAAAALAERHPRNLVVLQTANVNVMAQRLERARTTDLRRRSESLDSLAAQLQALSPQRVLMRGYTVTRLKKSGALVRSADQLKEGDRLVTRFHDGEAESVVDDGKQPRLFE
jgi:exodeoxyribonuclease VII large subunit